MLSVGIGDVAGAGGLAINRVAGAGLWVTLQLKYRPAGVLMTSLTDGVQSGKQKLGTFFGYKP